MGLVKYKDLKDNLLTDNRWIFASQIAAKEETKCQDGLDYYLALDVVESITKCIEEESAKIRHEIVRESVIKLNAGLRITEDEEKEHDKRLLSALDKMKEMQSLDYEVDFPMLKSRSGWYEALLYLFGRTNISEDIAHFIYIEDFPDYYKENNMEKLSNLTKEIFDNIKEATSRSIRLDSLEDITKEEREAAVSIDPSDKWAKINSLKRQQIALQNQSRNGAPESKIEYSSVLQNQHIEQTKQLRFNTVTWVDRVTGQTSEQNINSQKA